MEIQQETPKDPKISFHFHPYKSEQSLHLVEKEEGGRKRKYLKGIASGINLDHHGERMTANCIKSFMDQANSGELLLYPDLHGIRATEDIGKLIKAEITPGDEWLTEFRLYDQGDSVGPTTLEKADKLWRQIAGLPPYSKPRQKGFSVEGHIPENGIVQMSGDGKRVIDKVDLDGVVVVPRPAYKDSIAHAVYKALGETPPWVHGNALGARLREKMAVDSLKDGYYRQKSLIMDNLDEAVQDIMTDSEIADKKERLSLLFKEFEELMIELLLESSALFELQDELPQSPSAVSIFKGELISKNEMFRELKRNVRRLEKSMHRRLHYGS